MVPKCVARNFLHFEKCNFTHSWNPKQPFINGCFNWMIPNLYIENGCFTKHPFINGCLGFQVDIESSWEFLSAKKQAEELLMVPGGCAEGKEEPQKSG